MSLLQCQLEASSGQGLENLTVGDRFILNCDGEMPNALKPNSQFVFTEKQDQYQIHILDVVEATSQHFKAEVTGYKPGKFTKVLKISDGETTIDTNELNWTIESILDPQAKKEMVPSKGPFLMSYPLWIWLVLAGIAVSLSGIALIVFWRRRRRAKLLRELEEFRTPITPISQFGKDVRKLVRDFSFLKEGSSIGSQVEQVDRNFRLYLIRELMVPALQVSDREILKTIRKRYRGIYEIQQHNLRKVFSELSKAKGDHERMSLKDGEDLIFLTRNLAESIHDLTRKHK